MDPIGTAHPFPDFEMFVLWACWQGRRPARQRSRHDLVACSLRDTFCGTPWREDASQPNARSKKGFTSFATLTPCARISLSKSHESSFSSDRLEAHSKNEGGPGVR